MRNGPQPPGPGLVPQIMSMKLLNNILKTGKLVLLTQLKVASQGGSTGLEALLLLW